MTLVLSAKITGGSKFLDFFLIKQKIFSNCDSNLELVVDFITYFPERSYRNPFVSGSNFH